MLSEGGARICAADRRKQRRSNPVAGDVGERHDECDHRQAPASRSNRRRSGRRACSTRRCQNPGLAAWIWEAGIAEWTGRRPGRAAGALPLAAFRPRAVRLPPDCVSLWQPARRQARDQKRNSVRGHDFLRCEQRDVGQDPARDSSRDNTQRKDRLPSKQTPHRTLTAGFNRRVERVMRTKYSRKTGFTRARYSGGDGGAGQEGD